MRIRVHESRKFFPSAMILSTAAYIHVRLGRGIVRVAGGGGTIAEVNSFSRDAKSASLDLLPIIKWGVRAAARFIPNAYKIPVSRCRRYLSMTWWRQANCEAAGVVTVSGDRGSF